MNHVRLLETLLAEIIPGVRESRKQIIRFADETEYRNCLMHLRRMRKAIPSARRVLALSNIRSFSCALRCKDKLLKDWDGMLTVEEDMRVSVGPSSATSFAVGEQPSVPWGIQQIRAPDAWAYSQGQRIRIGVIDTGIDYHHPDLQGRIGRGINLMLRGALPVDDNGHGTHIAGTIAASGGIIGVAPQSIIHPVKAFDHHGSAYVSDIIQGIDWCVRQKLDIVNMSFGMKTRSKSLHEAVRQAVAAGVVIVSSSGNDGSSTRTDYPARYPETISVGALNRSRRISRFSNRGPSVDLYAPGERVLSTWVNGRYHHLSGSSMATSHVTGVVALMLASRPSLSPRRLKRLLLASARPLNLSGRTRTGELDAMRALRILRKKFP
ncbi:S8 family peptidase [Paenibacillus thermoaerophilus]|uniref:S8 family peptidase n=1 Tax=Paenibacillus thermoaerophilus TaxID=1215385 RepID=A0ABW2V7Z0_9BACL|nr:S8 family peptidase [Paenibacillus thermoaerophilus]